MLVTLSLFIWLKISLMLHSLLLESKSNILQSSMFYILQYNCIQGLCQEKAFPSTMVPIIAPFQEPPTQCKESGMLDSSSKESKYGYKLQQSDLPILHESLSSQLRGCRIIQKNHRFAVKGSNYLFMTASQ